MRLVPKVSVCIPAYNQAVYLKKAIDSVLQQTFTDYEIVVTDDSPGNIVKDLIEQYQLPDKIKYFKNQSTLGSPENWNEAIRMSTGEYIKILHHDDWLNFDNSLEKYVQLLDKNPAADFAFSATQAILPTGKNWVHSINTEQVEGIKRNPLQLFNNNLIGAPSTSIIRRNKELKFDRNLKWVVDIEYYIRQIVANNKIIYSAELLVVTFLGEGRVTDECINSKAVEVNEYLYLLNKIYKSKNLYYQSAVKKCILYAIQICNKYHIKNVEEIRNCGYNENIHPAIKKYLAINGISSLLGNFYLKLLPLV